MSRILEAYPAVAKREKWEGTVGLTVTVSAEGRATHCMVTQPSGHAILDDAACSGMIRYARFEPALDPQGHPTTDDFSISITYGGI